MDLALHLLIMHTFMFINIILFVLLDCCAGISYKRIIVTDQDRLGNTEEMENYKMAEIISIASPYMCGMLCFKQNCKLYTFDKNGNICTMYNSTVKIPAPAENLHVFAKFGNGSCSKGYTQFGKSCFFLVKAPAKWTSAQMKCRELGGTLARATSAEVNAVLKKMARSQGSSVWIGGYKSQRIWKWDESKEKITFSNWCPGNPDGSGACMHLWSSVGWAWDDTVCTVKKPFICESLSNL